MCPKELFGLTVIRNPLENYSHLLAYLISAEVRIEYCKQRINEVLGANLCDIFLIMLSHLAHV